MSTKTYMTANEQAWLEGLSKLSQAELDVAAAATVANRADDAAEDLLRAYEQNLEVLPGAERRARDAYDAAEAFRLLEVRVAFIRAQTESLRQMVVVRMGR